MATTIALTSCNGKQNAPSWNNTERILINSADSVMRVLTVGSDSDVKVLRGQCSNFTAMQVASGTYARLAAKMIATVTSPEQDGVGIAGPQVGINRRIVAVMRYDKAGHPFEVFPNIRIVSFNGEMQPGPEGCLSVPGRRGNVLRYQDIDICYTSPVTHKDTTENIQGYTAVIFQHECDHLDGILYTDKLIDEE